MRIWWVLVLVVALFGGAATLRLSGRKSAPWRQPPTWQAVGPGIEMSTFGGQRAARVTAVRADATRCAIRVVDAHRGIAEAGAMADIICPSTGAAINASYFAEDLSPLGLLVVDGVRVNSRAPSGAWGTFRVRHGRPELVKSTGGSARGITQAVECKPRLVIDGTIPTFKAQSPARRSAVGVDAQGRVVFAAADDVLTLEQWAVFLRDTLGCVNALNLDGGPSTQLAVRGDASADVPGGWHVPAFLTVSPAE